MNFSQFYSLAESLASLPLKPEKHDPKDPQSVARAKLASRDEAPRQQVARLVGGAAQTKDQQVRDTQKAATMATGVKFGDEQDPVDRLIHQIAEQSLKVVVARAKAPPDTGFRFPKIKIAW